MKKFLKMLLPLFLVVAVFTACSSKPTEGTTGGETTETTDTIKIGTIYAMSGDKAAIGENILRGIDFAVKEINDAGGVNGRMLEVVRGDHAADAASCKDAVANLGQRSRQGNALQPRSIAECASEVAPIIMIDHIAATQSRG